MPSEVSNLFIDHVDVLMTLLFNSGVHCKLCINMSLSSMTLLFAKVISLCSSILKRYQRFLRWDFIKVYV